MMMLVMMTVMVIMMMHCVRLIGIHTSRPVGTAAAC
jgi:hypothetical protein